MLEVTETMACVIPLLQLAVEESRDAAVFHDVCLALEHLSASLQLHGAQAVFVEIVGVYSVDTQGGVAVATPTTAKV